MRDPNKGIDVREELVSAFQKSTSAVFSTMLGVDVRSGPVCDCDLLLAMHEVSGIIGLSGRLTGDVIVSFDREVAILATGAMLGEQPTELDNDVVDAVGELTNMIAGGAKGALGKYDLQLALPTVILGSGHRIGFKPGVQPVLLPFDSEWGPFSVGFGIMDVGAPALSC